MQTMMFTINLSKYDAWTLNNPLYLTSANALHICGIQYYFAQPLLNSYELSEETNISTLSESLPSLPDI